MTLVYCDQYHHQLKADLVLGGKAHLFKSRNAKAQRTRSNIIKQK